MAAMTRGRKIMLAASTSESSEHLHSAWNQMLLATHPSRCASVFNVACTHSRARYTPAFALERH
jgi:hypothetical protein